jgi:hypothetical protein
MNCSDSCLPSALGAHKKLLDPRLQQNSNFLSPLEFAVPPARALPFHTADGQTTATLERVIDRTGQVPVLKTLESVVFCSNEMGEYLIAELQVDDEYGDFASLIYLESGKEEWSFRTMECPLMSEWRKKNKVEDRKWLAHGSASDGRMLWWFDLPALPPTAGSPYRALHEATGDIQTKRCITLSRNKLRYVEIEESGTLIMWTWSCGTPTPTRGPGCHGTSLCSVSSAHRTLIWSTSHWGRNSSASMCPISELNTARPISWRTCQGRRGHPLIDILSPGTCHQVRPPQESHIYLVAFLILCVCQILWCFS